MWHECDDIDLALWLSDLADLNRLRRAYAKALRVQFNSDGIGVATHQIDVFIMEPGIDRNLGRLCAYNTCPRGKIACHVPGCGDVRFLQQHNDFAWWPDPLAEGQAVWLFNHAGKVNRRAAGLPLARSA